MASGVLERIRTNLVPAVVLSLVLGLASGRAVPHVDEGRSLRDAIAVLG